MLARVVYCAAMSRRAPLLCLLVAAPMAATAEDPIAAGRGRILQHLEHGQIDRAVAETQRTAAMPRADQDPALQVLLARTWIEAGDIERAAGALDRAEGLDHKGATAAAFELRRRIQVEFGALEIVPAEGGTVRGSLLVEAAGPLGGLLRQRAFERIRDRLTGLARRWPGGVVLPWGRYRIHGVFVDHAPNAPPTRAVVPFPRVAILRPEGDGAVHDAVSAFLGGFGGRLEAYDTGRPDAAIVPMLADLGRSPPALVVAIGQRAAELARLRLASIRQVTLRVTDRAALDALGRPPREGRVLAGPAPRDVLVLLQRLAPETRTVALLYEPHASAGDTAEAASAASALGIGLRLVGIDRPGAVPAALAALGGTIDAFWLMDGPATSGGAALASLLRHAYAAGRPVVASHLEQVQQGAVMAVEVDPASEGRLAAALANALVFPADPAGPPPREVRPDGRLIVGRRPAARLGLQLSAVIVRDAWRVVDVPLPPELAGP